VQRAVGGVAGDIQRTHVQIPVAVVGQRPVLDPGVRDADLRRGHGGRAVVPYVAVAADAAGGVAGAGPGAGDGADLGPDVGFVRGAGTARGVRRLHGVDLDGVDRAGSLIAVAVADVELDAVEVARAGVLAEGGVRAEDLGRGGAAGAAARGGLPGAPGRAAVRGDGVAGRTHV